jgi:putative redox protein
VSPAIPTAQPKPPARIHVEWLGEETFDAGRPNGPPIRLDGTGKTAQSPVDALLSALGTCTSVDVVEILAKMRTPVTSLQVDVIGERVTTVPHRFSHITLVYHVVGRDVQREQAERAIELAVNKYCSVRDSLARDINVDWKLDLRAPET